MGASSGGHIRPLEKKAAHIRLSYGGPGVFCVIYIACVLTWVGGDFSHIFYDLHFVACVGSNDKSRVVPVMVGAIQMRGGQFTTQGPERWWSSLCLFGPKAWMSWARVRLHTGRFPM